VKKINLSKVNSLALIFLSIVASWLIVNIGVDYGGMELVSLLFWVGPFFIGVITILLFLVIDWGFSRIRFWITLTFILINIILAVYFRVGSG
jgi:hypothetical protein